MHLVYYFSVVDFEENIMIQEKDRYFQIRKLLTKFEIDHINIRQRLEPF